MKWKSIETARKDGSWILVKRVGLTPTSASTAMPPAVVRWNERYPAGDKKPKGGWEGVDTGSPCLCKPVYWTPINEE